MRTLRHILSSIVRLFYHSYLNLMGINIGKNSMISLGAKIDIRRGDISIGNNVVITYGVVVLSHDYSTLLMGHPINDNINTFIEDNVFIGVNSVILPGIRIGRNSVIGAGTIVTKDVPPASLVVGNPGKVIKNLQIRDDIN